MRFTCDRSELNVALQLIVGVVDPRHIKQLLQSVRVEVSKDVVVLCATDLEVGMRYTLSGVDIDEPGKVILPAMRVASIVRESRNDRLLLASEDVSCVIEGADSRYHVLAQQGEDFPDIPRFGDGDGLEIEGAILREMVRMTVFAAAPEKMRYALNGVFLAVKENSQQVHMVATDGRRLAWIQRKANKKSPVTAEVIIPTKGALQLERIVSETEVAKLRLDERHLFAKTGDVEMVAQLVDGMFPSYKEAMPKDLDRKIEIGADVLASGLRRAALLSNPDEETRAVALRLADNKILLASSAPNAGDAKVEIETDYDGEEVNVSVNPDYMIDGLKALGAAVVVLELKDGTRPCLIKHGKDYVYLTMPIT